MPWKECCAMTERAEFVHFVENGSSNVSELCRRFGISRKTGYKWLKRYEAEGKLGLVNRSRRPKSHPARTQAKTEARILEERDAHRAWGGRKIRARLKALKYESVPAASTITEILRRHGRLNAQESQKHRAYQRFEYEAANDLWQMDFKGHFALSDGTRCHPLTVLDDHSRFAVGLRACVDECGETVQGELIELFRCYGMPRKMLMDNGSPWGSDVEQGFTPLTLWLIRLGIRVSHGRPYHPQTQGKDERFHRTLKAELLQWNQFRDQESAQCGFDSFRVEYNQDRPHESLGMEVPARRYAPSERVYPERLPEIEYGPGMTVRRVQAGGKLHFEGQEYRVGKGLRGQAVGLKAGELDGVWAVYFCQHQIARIDQRKHRVVLGESEAAADACPASGRCAPSGRASIPNHQSPISA